MLTVHHGKVDAMTILGASQGGSEKAMNVEKPELRDLRKCSASNCDKHGTEKVKFKICAPCKDAGKNVPYCSRSVPPHNSSRLFALCSYHAYNGPWQVLPGVRLDMWPCFGVWQA
jgi:hypothetical protein